MLYRSIHSGMMKSVKRKRFLSAVLAFFLIFETVCGNALTARAEETENLAGDVVITSAEITPEQVAAKGGNVSIKVTGTNLTSDNWGVRAEAFIAGTDVSMADRFPVTVSEITESGAVLAIPVNTMRNTIEYRISVGALSANGIEKQCSVTLLQEKKAESVQVNPRTVEMTDASTIVATMEQNITLGADGEEVLKEMIYIADYGNENSNRFELTENDSVTIVDNQIVIVFDTMPDLRSVSALYVEEGAFKTESGVNLKAFSWIIVSRPMVTDIELEDAILESNGGLVEGVLKGVRLNEATSISAKIMKAGSAGTTEIPVYIGEGSEPSISFELPQNDTEFTQSYSIDLTMGDTPVYVEAVVSVLPTGVADTEQTLAALTISGNNKIYANDNSTEIIVKVSPQVGELKTRLNLYGTNLDSTKTEVRAIDQNGIVWPVYHIPECDGTIRFVAIAGINKNGVKGDGNSQIIEVLPPRLVGPNMTYTLQVALDGENFIDAMTVKLTVDNEEIQNETGFEQCTTDTIKDVTVKHVDENGVQIAEDDIYKGYPVSMVQGLGIVPKDIPGYELIGMKESIDWDNDFVTDGKTYTYEYRKLPEIKLPKAPSSAKAVLSGSHNSVKFSWSKSEGADGYFVYYKKASANVWTKAGNTTVLSYTKKNLAANVKYNFKVVPYINVNGEKLSDDTQYKTVTITTKKNIKAPATVKAVLSGGYDDVKVNWTKVTGAAGYYVSMKKAGAASYTSLGTTTKLSYVKKNLADGVKYTFKIVPYYKNGTTKVKGFYSKTASVYTLKKLAVPKVMKSTSKKVKVSWTNIQGETGYQISRAAKKTGTNIVSTYATTTGKNKTLTVTKGKKYYYKVRAYKTVNGKKIFGPWSNVKAYTLK